MELVLSGQIGSDPDNFFSQVGSGSIRLDPQSFTARNVHKDTLYAPVVLKLISAFGHLVIIYKQDNILNESEVSALKKICAYF